MWCVHQLIQLSVTVYIGVDGRYQEWLQKNKVQHVHSEGEGEMEHAHNRHNRFGQLHSFCTHVPPSIHKSNYNCLAAAAVPTVIACSHLLAAALCYSAPVWPSYLRQVWSTHRLNSTMRLISTDLFSGYQSLLTLNRLSCEVRLSRTL